MSFTFVDVGRALREPARNRLRLQRAFIGFLLMASATLSLSASGSSAPLRIREPGVFERNLGQHNSSILYSGRFDQFDAAITADGALNVRARGGKQDAVMAIRLIAAKPPAKVVPSDQVEYRTNYFRGDGKSFTDVPHFQRVLLKDVFDGVDLAYHSAEGKLEYDLILAPGIDARKLALKIEGADSLRVDDAGDLHIQQGSVHVVQRKPVAFQLDGGARVDVPVRYELRGDQSAQLVIGSYNKGQPLVIDPVVEYASYMGGTTDDLGKAVTIGPGGYLYVAGTTWDFPVVNAYDSSSSNQDVFVAKFHPATGRAVYATYLGVRGNEDLAGIAVDANSSVYVTGIAQSGFPTTAGAYQTTFSSSGTGFVTKFSPAGNSLAYSTFLVGATPKSIVVDSTGRALISGAAGSAFTTTFGAYQSTYAGDLSNGNAPHRGDAFALLLNAAGSSATFATLLGGADMDEARGAVFDTAGRIVIGGVTNSTNLPIAGTAFQPVLSGSKDGFMAILSSTGSALTASTYLGGSGQDEITGVAADPFGGVAASGIARSNNFPLSGSLVNVTTVNHFSYSKGFVAQFDSPTLLLRTSSFIGSSSDCCETATGVAIDAAGDVYVVGTIDKDDFGFFSSVRPFASTSYMQSKFGSSYGQAVFAAALTRNADAFRYHTLVAPCGNDVAVCRPPAIGTGVLGRVAITGATLADWLSITPANSLAAVHPDPLGVTNDAFLMTLGMEEDDLTLAVSSTSPSPGIPVAVTATSYGAGATGTVTFWDGASQIGTASLVRGAAVLNASLPVGIRKLKATLGSFTTSTVSLPVARNGVCTP